ncbi:hypothetical protein BO94DRAFT_601757 [Aspergillus sclerotioniger CBS 115572]|uniref:Uncharacterized protein n=1 Tax=Aspergillus sclerotioniger CBS 115572 TaxID=1450535 RepID=A0A317W7R9_9EURO|nr:hypothetical protein BO94DRAFT_601757 [Aspergillus sclerotioniger CBS 115572]PWY81721.1 hypothetical protein BO94DRAFT_601757 [Aspergillus sclerotioniger CBS 115572]
MAAQVLGDIDRVRKDELQEYGGKESIQFVEGVKASALFQCNWGELLAAAPTALSLMGSCWIAASNPIADRISLADAVPTGGFKHLTNRMNPTLRACLVDVCNNGGREAFYIAGNNMDAIQIRSRQICDERIRDIFTLLGPCDRDAAALQDFNDALKDFSNDAKTCGRLASEIRDAFQKWARMVGELHACTEQQVGTTSQERHKVSTDQIIAEAEKIHSAEAAEMAQKQVDYIKAQVTKAEQRLDKAIDKVPGPWETMAQTAVNGCMKVLGQAVAVAVPALIASVNPGGAIASGAVAAASTQAASAQVQQQQQQQQQHQPQASLKPVQNPDPAYMAAVGLQDPITHFYQYLGGESGSVDWPKFKDGANGEEQNGAGIAYVLGNFKGQRANIDKTGTSPNQQLITALDTVINVAQEISTHLSKENQLSTTPLADEIPIQWRKKVQKSQQVVLEMAAYASALGSGRQGPNVFTQVDTSASADDYSVQAAQVQGAMQGVEMASSALELAQKNYQATLDRQAKTATAMTKIELRLRRLQEDGKTLDQIKGVLRDCISVLADLSVQISRLERFFLMLSNLIDQLIMPCADRFSQAMTKAGMRLNGKIALGNVTKQSIYLYTLQIKGYFSLLMDISGMYTRVHRDYIQEGVELCLKLSSGAADQHATSQMESELSRYTARSTKGIAQVVSDEQEKIISGLSARAQMAQQTARLIEQRVQESSVAISHTAKLAIEEGTKELKVESQAIIKEEVSVTVAASQEIDANDF